MSDASNTVHFIAYHTLFLLVYFVGIAFTWKTISKLRDTGAAYNARLPSAYYSLTSWILWALQYLVIIVWLFPPSSDDIFLSTALWIGVVQNALWAIATFSLYSKPFSRWSVTLPSLMVFSILIAFLGYRTEILASLEFATLEALLSVAIFTAFALSIRQLGLGKAFVAAFVIHGLSQWIWRGLLFSPSPTMRVAILLGLPIWRSALLFSWMKVTPKLLQIAQSPEEVSVGLSKSVEVNPQTLPVRPKESRLGESYTDANVELILLPFRVMISSTVDDLVDERNAVENAIKALHLTRFRAETFGSLPHTPRTICEFMAERCDLFILIIGERYGSIIEPERISVVEFEYKIARAQNPAKILVYVKDGVTREPRLQEFLEKVGDFESGSFWYLFTTPDELNQKIQPDVMAYLTGQVKKSKRP